MQLYPLPRLLLLLLLLLTGCTGTPTIETPETTEADRQLLQEAKQLARYADHSGASLRYEQLAATVPENDRSRYLILAAEEAQLANEADRVAILIQKIDNPQLPEGLLFRKTLLNAELELGLEHPELAFNLLDQPLPTDSSTTLQTRYHKARAEAFRQMGNILESANELSLIDPLIEELTPRLENQFAIIESLAVMTDNALELMQPYPPGLLGGWMELTRIIKAHAGNNAELQPLLDQWHDHFPEHPAMPELLNGYFTQLKAQYRTAKHIAVLLPKSGPYTEPANAIRDGILTAYYNQPVAERPTLVFYDNNNVSDTWPNYQAAVKAGADLVIGPLIKEAVEQFTRAGELPIPVLALNQVAPEVNQPVDLYQFGLSPEDEARQAANRAWSDGYRHAVALVSDNDWGSRIATAFRDQLERLGGRVMETGHYNPTSYDYSTTIKGLLNLDASEARRRQVQRTLGERLEFKPRRRRDIDFIFMAAQAQNAHQIRPQLQFHHAADLPLYSTSNAYSGTPDSSKDVDIEGLIFPDLPWILEEENTSALSRQRLTPNLSAAANRYPRLFAMGIDSYQLIPHLARLQSNPREQTNGATGKLWLDAIGHIHHQMLWAKIRNALPEPLGYTPALPEDSQLMETGVSSEVPASQETTEGTPPGAAVKDISQPSD